MTKRPTAMLISVSGIDGAGKSTQIEHLCRSLDEAGRSYRLFRFWDDVAALKKFREDVGHRVFKGDKGVGSPEAPIRRRDKNVQSPLVTLVRLGVYFLDALSLRLFASQAAYSGVDIVIFDRYLYDELANLDLASPWARWYARFLAGIVPVPGVSLILDANPEEAFARKPEYPLEFLHRNRRAYLALAKLFGHMTVIPARTIEEVKGLVTAAVGLTPELPVARLG